MATDTKMAMMTLSALSVLSRSLKTSVGSPAILMTARIKAPPSSSNTSDTVVEVGMPSELNTSSTMTSVTMTARNSTITSLMAYWLGVIMPWRATSIMPDDITAPMMTPHEATSRMVRKVATRAPTADCMKLTASLLTPTNRSKNARQSRNTTISR